MNYEFTIDKTFGSGEIESLLSFIKQINIPSSGIKHPNKGIKVW